MKGKAEERRVAQSCEAFGARGGVAEAPFLGEALVHGLEKVDQDALGDGDCTMLVDFAVHARTQGKDLAHVVGDAFVKGEDGAASSSGVDDACGRDEPADRHGVGGAKDCQGVAHEVVELVHVKPRGARVNDVHEEALRLRTTHKVSGPRLGRVEAADEESHEAALGQCVAAKVVWQKDDVRAQEAVEDVKPHLLVRPIRIVAMHVRFE